jgi:hypothetical protein
MSGAFNTNRRPQSKDVPNDPHHAEFVLPCRADLDLIALPRWSGDVGQAQVIEDQAGIASHALDGGGVGTV